MLIIHSEDLMRNMETLSGILPERPVQKEMQENTDSNNENRELHLREVVKLDAKKALAGNELARYKKLRDELGESYKPGMYLEYLNEEAVDAEGESDEVVEEITEKEPQLTPEQMAILRKGKITAAELRALTSDEQLTENQVAEKETGMLPGEELVRLSLQPHYSKEEIDTMMEKISMKLTLKGEDPDEAWEFIDQSFDPNEKGELIRFLKKGEVEEISKGFVDAFVRIKRDGV